MGKAPVERKESIFNVYREAFMDLLFPLDLSCHICKEPLRENRKQEGALHYEDYLCLTCIDEIPWIEEPSCKKCSIPLYRSSANCFETSPDKVRYEEEILRPLPRPKNLCIECSEDSPLDRNISLCLYEKPIKSAIYAFKYSDKTYIARIFALMMASKIRSLPKDEQNFDLILSVPLHKKRLRHRGYNQSDLLAKHLSKELQIPYDSKALSRIKETRIMNQLSKSQRIQNVQDAFFLKNNQNNLKKAKKILLIDDIYTTGATAKSIAEALKKQGAAHITMLSIARVVLK